MQINKPLRWKFLNVILIVVITINRPFERQQQQWKRKCNYRYCYRYILRKKTKKKNKSTSFVVTWQFKEHLLQLLHYHICTFIHAYIHICLMSYKKNSVIFPTLEDTFKAGMKRALHRALRNKWKAEHIRPVLYGGCISLRWSHRGLVGSVLAY